MLLEAMMSYSGVDLLQREMRRQWIPLVSERKLWVLILNIFLARGQCVLHGRFNHLTPICITHVYTYVGLYVYSSYMYALTY